MTDAQQPAPQAAWLQERERGSVFWIAAAFRLATLFGRLPTRPLVAMVALYYRLFARSSVRASRDWLRTVLGREPGFFEVYRHIRTFAQVTLDKAFLMTGRHGSLRFTRTGDHLLAEQVASGRGAVLLGAHLGSYDAMRAGGVADGVPIHILGYFANARRINSLIERLDPESAARVIHLGDDPVGVAVRIRERIEQGDLVALLGDRTGLNEKTVTAEFFGRPAEFPAGPFLLASLLRCPVYLVFGLYHAPNRYDLYCEPFAERLEIPRGRRAEALAECVQRYADKVADYAGKAPYNWFNFFDFWRTAK